MIPGAPSICVLIFLPENLKSLKNRSLLNLSKRHIIRICIQVDALPQAHIRWTEAKRCPPALAFVGNLAPTLTAGSDLSNLEMRIHINCPSFISDTLNLL